MNIRLLIFAAACLSLGDLTSRAATVTWDGGGADFSWQNVLNWAGNTMPGPADDVVINMTGGLTVVSSVNVSIKSLQCSNNLSIVGAAFEVTGGNSLVQGTLALSIGARFSTRGSGTSLTANGVTTANDTDFTVSDGATFSLPGLQNFTKDCVGANWTITGSNSVLDLPGLTNITGLACGYPVIQATAGGRLRATNLATITAGPLTFLADGAGSLIEFSGLRNCAGNANYPLVFEARNQGAFIAPSLTTLSNVDVSVRGGSVVSLPGLRNFTKDCVGANWTITGSNSVLDLPGLTNITGAACSFPVIQATAGGRFRAINLATITAGPLTFLADGAGSLIDCSGLQTCAGSINYEITFLVRNGGKINLSSLTNLIQKRLTLEVQNSGNFIFADHLFFLTGVTVKSPSLSPLLPTKALFHGKTWHSYLIEMRDTLRPELPWEFVRVPMTNDFYSVPFGLPPRTEYRASEFIADPPIVDLWKHPGLSVQVVLYGATNKTYALESTNRLPETFAEWPRLATVIMTNAFRILPAAPATAKHLFYRARE